MASDIAGEIGMKYQNYKWQPNDFLREKIKAAVIEGYGEFIRSQMRDIRVTMENYLTEYLKESQDALEARIQDVVKKNLDQKFALMVDKAVVDRLNSILHELGKPTI